MSHYESLLLERNASGLQRNVVLQSARSQDLGLGRSPGAGGRPPRERRGRGRDPAAELPHEQAQVAVVSPGRADAGRPHGGHFSLAAAVLTNYEYLINP